ncbi:unnamed protein product, partial [Prorocentrum cordatum]
YRDLGFASPRVADTARGLELPSEQALVTDAQHDLVPDTLGIAPSVPTTAPLHRGDEEEDTSFLAAEAPNVPPVVEDHSITRRATLQEDRITANSEDGDLDPSTREAPYVPPFVENYGFIMRDTLQTQCVPPNIENCGFTMETTMSNTLQGEKLPEDRGPDFLAMEAPHVLQCGEKDDSTMRATLQEERLTYTVEEKKLFEKQNDVEAEAGGMQAESTLAM